MRSLPRSIPQVRQIPKTRYSLAAIYELHSNESSIESGGIRFESVFNHVH